MWRWSRAVALAALLLSQGPAHAQMTEARFDEAVAANAKYRAEMFERYGFRSGSKAAAEGRSLRRFHFRAGLTWTPPVELERRGRNVTMRVAIGDGRIVERSAPAGMWKRLAKLDKQTFARAVYDPVWLNQPRTWSSCHGDQIDLEWIEGGQVRSTGGNQCGGSVERTSWAKYEVTAIFARAVLFTQPRCKDLTATNPVLGLETCYTARLPLGGGG